MLSAVGTKSGLAEYHYPWYKASWWLWAWCRRCFKAWAKWAIAQGPHLPRGPRESELPLFLDHLSLFLYFNLSNSLFPVSSWGFLGRPERNFSTVFVWQSLFGIIWPSISRKWLIKFKVVTNRGTPKYALPRDPKFLLTTLHGVPLSFSKTVPLWQKPCENEIGALDFVSKLFVPSNPKIHIMKP